MSPEPLRLYLVSDDRLCSPARLLELLPELVEAGVSMVQLRDKSSSTRALVECARALLARLRPRGVPLLINDRADVAFAAEADGVHLGQDDLSISAARRLLGPRAIIGASMASLDPVALDDLEGADYLAASPVFGTPTKTDTGPPLGLEGVAQLVERAKVPVIGIGGLDAARAGQVVRRGAAGAAVVSAILAAPDPVAATRALRRAVDEARA